MELTYKSRTLYEQRRRHATPLFISISALFVVLGKPCTIRAGHIGLAGGLHDATGEDYDMLEKIVRYLHSSIIPFRLASYVTPELEPKVGHPIPRGGMLVDSRVALVDGQAVLTCFPADERIDLIALGNELGGVAVEANRDELREGLRDLEGPIPPLGQLLGLPLILDQRVGACAIVVFRAGQSDYFEIAYDDFARKERPRVAGFALAGELPRPAQGHEAAAH